jgi:hypothetical protein
MSEIFIMQGLMTVATLMLGFVPIIVAVVCYFLSRAQERRTGTVLYSGKSAIIFTLMNNSAWLFTTAWFLIIYNILGDTESYSFGAEEPEKNWSMFRIGFSMLLCTSVSMGLLALFWKRWSEGGSIIPKENIFVKCYSGLNVFVLSGLVLYLGILLFSLLLEATVRDDTNLDSDVLIVPSVMLVCAFGFLVPNVWIFGRSSDDPPK